MARVRIEVPPESVEPNPVQPPVEHQPTQHTAHPKTITLPKVDPKKLMIFAGLIIVFAGLFILLNDRRQLRQEVNQLSANKTTSQTDTQKYVQAVSKLVETPQEVTPDTRVLNQESLNQLSKDNLLYKTAKVDDVILVYKNTDNSLFIVIYRPSTQKVILATAATQGSGTTTPTTKK